MPTSKKSIQFERESQPTPGELYFIFCNHAYENYQRIIDAIERARPDIVAMELAGETDLARSDMESEVNAQLRGNDPGEFAGDIGWLEEDMIARLKGTGIRYVAIDADADSEADKLVSQASQHRKGYEQYHNDTSPAAAVFRRHYAEQYIDATVRGDVIREDVMADQLEAIADANPGQRIAVVVGMIHDNIAHEIADDIPVSSVYVPKEADEERLAELGEHGRFTRYELGQRALAAGTMELSEVMRYCLDKNGRFIDYDD